MTLAALAAGKVVISANKALICAHGAEIFETARRHGGHFLFEASVAGGIPIIKALREGLVANRFPLIYGILNGTCNYILTQMEEQDAPYTAVLGEAKALGYAEADESLDVQGWDTAHKAAVLAFLAHHTWVKPGQMIVEGIDRITPADFKHAVALGYGIKLLAVIARDFETDELSVRVHPTLLPESHVVAKVSGVFNAVSVRGDVAGTTLYIGRGAGQDATSSAVISDLVDAVALLKNDRRAFITARKASAPARPARACRLAPLEHIRCRYYLRMTVSDEPGVLAQVATAISSASRTSPGLCGRRSPSWPGCAACWSSRCSCASAISPTDPSFRPWHASFKNMAAPPWVTSNASRMSPSASRRRATRATSSLLSSPPAPASRTSCSPARRPCASFRASANSTCCLPRASRRRSR